MKWFREDIFFSRDYTDIPQQLLEYSGDSNMLNAISEYAKAADFGIEEMQFEIENKEIDGAIDFPENIPEGMKSVLTSFMQILSETSNNSEGKVTCSHHLNLWFWSGGFLLNGSTEPSIYKLSSRAPRFLLVRLRTFYCAVDVRVAHHPVDALYRNTCGQCQGPERMPGHVVGQVLFHA